MSNYGQQPPNPYQQNPYGQQPGPYQQGQQPQGPYGQPVQYGQRPQYGQPQYGQQPPANPYQQPNPYADARQPQQSAQLAAPGQQPGTQQGPWVAQTPSRPTVVPRAIPVVTLESLPGREITEIIGDVVGVIARSRDLPPELRAGGMEAGYVSMLTRSRQEAVARAVEMAESAGADAIVGLRFDCSEITQNLSEVVAYGTAVKLAPQSGGSQTNARQTTSAASASDSEPTISTPRPE
ncbi:MAG: heavy metal-binding domain-containing protein [Microlunatus sp.]